MNVDTVFEELVREIRRQNKVSTFALCVPRILRVTF